MPNRSSNEITSNSPAISLDNAEIRKQIMREMGRIGGLKGGRSRADSLSKERLREIASKAAKARWSKIKNA